MAVNRPVDPQVGSRLSVQSFRERVSNPLYANDVALDQRLANLEALVAALPNETSSPTIPSAAEVGDKWYDTTEAGYPIPRICTSAYTGGTGTILGNWAQFKDPRAQQAANTATSTANSATQTIVDDVIPDAATEGWIWVDTRVPGKHKTFVCRETYASGPIDPVTTPETSQWLLTVDVTAELFAATVEGLLDNKTNTFVDSTVPDAADARDMWVDTDGDDATYYARYSYTDTDGAAWQDAPVAYAVGERVRVGLSYYVALQPNSGSAPTLVNTDWSYIDDFTSLTAFRESFWRATAGVVALSLARAVETVANGKSGNYYQPTYPDSANTNDTWIDTANGQGYVCETGYLSGQGIDPVSDPVNSQWKVVTDSEGRNILQNRIDTMSVVLDGKTSTWYSDLVPVAADAADLWVDINDGRTMLINVFPYPYTSSDGADVSEIGSGPYPEGKIVFSTDRHYRAAVETSQLPPHADWVDVGIRTIAAWSSGATYEVGANVSYSGQIWRARKPSNATDPHTPGAVGEEFWATVASTASSTALFRAECWKLTSDAFAQRIADDAAALADRKAVSYVQDSVPTEANLGDLWTDTDDELDPVNLPGIYRQYKCYNPYTAATYQDLGSHWIKAEDAVAQQIANDAQAAVDNKRTTFVTSLTEPTSSWPSGGADGGTAINFWSRLPKGPGDVIAQEGDLWVNFYNGKQYVRVCKTGYQGTPGDPGSMGKWNAFSLDGLLIAELAGYYKLNGDNLLTAPINFNRTGVVEYQDFIGRSVSVSGTGTIKGEGYCWHNGTQANPNAVPSVDSAIAHRKFVIDLINDILDGCTITGNVTISKDDAIMEVNDTSAGGVGPTFRLRREGVDKGGLRLDGANNYPSVYSADENIALDASNGGSAKRIVGVRNPENAQEADTMGARDSAISTHAALTSGVHGLGTAAGKTASGTGTYAVVSSSGIPSASRWIHGESNGNVAMASTTGGVEKLCGTLSDGSAVYRGYGSSGSSLDVARSDHSHGNAKRAAVTGTNVDLNDDAWHTVMSIDTLDANGTSSAWMLVGGLLYNDGTTDRKVQFSAAHAAGSNNHSMSVTTNNTSGVWVNATDSAEDGATDFGASNEPYFKLYSDSGTVYLAMKNKSGHNRQFVCGSMVGLRIN